MGRELGTVTPILECDCTSIFTVLLLLVDGLEVFVALSFVTVVIVAVVVVVTGCGVEESSKGIPIVWWVEAFQASRQL